MSKKKPSSSTLIWDFKHERFQLLYDDWNVDRAKQIIKDKPRPIIEIDISELKKLVGAPGKILFAGIAVDWKKAQSDRVNLDDPILAAYGRGPGLFPIDGWHRIAKALLQGRTTLPGVKLTREESKQVHHYSGHVRRMRRRRRRRAITI